MPKFVLGIGVVAVLIIVGLVVVDLTTMPPATTSQCVFKRNFILPDQCITGCMGGEPLCTVATRPYLFFFTQAARCADAIICGGK